MKDFQHYLEAITSTSDFNKEPEPVKTKPNIVKVSGKVSDMLYLKFQDKEYDGYVPEDCGIGGGDYLEFAIDLETGKILGWKKDKFLEFIKEQ